MTTDMLLNTVNFTPTRMAGQERLANFVLNAGARYRNERNFDYGPNDRANVSALSPWVRHRLITEQEIAETIVAHYALGSVEKFIQEVLWRTYWKGWLELRPSVFTAYETGRNDALDALAANRGLQTAYDQAISGRTGIECFDAWATELVETGYLHNHARMWFASIWIFTLRLDWHLGADFFLRHLMDGDAASNTLSWRWVAGLQTRGKHYLARASNISKFTNGRFSPKGLNENAGPLDDEGYGAAAMLEPADRLDATKPTFVIITDDDCALEKRLSKSLDVAGVATLSSAQATSPMPMGERASAFKQGALDDAGARFSKAYQCSVDRLNAASLADAVAKSGAQQVLIPWPTAGVSRNHFAPIIAQLCRQGHSVVEWRDPWDDRAWPYATKGFFPFKEKIPRLLADAGLDLSAKQRAHS